MRTLSSDEGVHVAGGMDTVTVTGRRSGLGDPLRFGFLNDIGAYANTHSMLVAVESGRDDRSGDPTREAADVKAAEVAEKLDEVVVEASRCGMPVAELFSLESSRSGEVWGSCFENLSVDDKSKLRHALDIIAKGLKPSDSLKPIELAYKALMTEDLKMVEHLSAAVAANDGHWFGENLATLSKGGWKSQIIIGLIKGVFKATTR